MWLPSGDFKIDCVYPYLNGRGICVFGGSGASKSFAFSNPGVDMYVL